MTPERWLRIEEIYHAAREREPNSRAGFVTEACGGDLDLEREILTLLDCDISATGAILNRPVMQADASDATASPAPGARLGPYEIQAPLGAGGMGTVFRARDTRLGRPVAIKIGQARFSDRFEREARAISALNHPNICTLYDVGANYLVMELVEGDTLAARLKKGALPIETAVSYGAQIADALAAAHAKGIIHRDLKPANVMIAKSGVKVLDFGLAKSDEDQTVTATQAMVGTPAYMAPEQREGRGCDARTDIYALGLILKECIAGRAGRSGGVSGGVSSGMSAVSPQLAHVVERCLEADPENRWQSARDVKRELEFALAQPTPAAAPAPPQHARSWIWWAAAAVAAVGLAVAARTWLTRTTSPPKVVRLAIALPEEDAQVDPGRLNGPPAISPDGAIVVMPLRRGSEGALWVRRLDSDRFERLAGTEQAAQPFWSPDGKQIAFFAGGKLKKMRVPDGAPETLCEVKPEEARGAAWSSRGAILFGINYTGLKRVPESGGQAALVAGIDASIQENSLRFPVFLADGNRFIYFSRTADPRLHGIYLDALDGSGKRPRKKLVDADGPAELGRDPYSGRDFLLFPKDGHLWAQQFDNGAGAVTGERRSISDDVGQFSLSATGSLVYRRAASELNSLTWFDRSGRRDGTIGQPGDYWDVGLAPDERYVSVINHRSAEGRFWVELIDIARNLQTPFTDPSAISRSPTWSRDSKQIYYLSMTGAEGQIEVKPVDGAGTARVLSRSQPRYDLHDLSPDGKTFLAERWIAADDRHLALSPSAQLEWQPLAAGGSIAAMGQFSPDGRAIAYESNESGSLEVYLTDFPAMQRRLRISTSGGAEPRWRHDGKELFYLAPGGVIAAVAMAGSLEMAAAKPAALVKFAVRADNAAGFQYAVTRDGQRFLVVDHSASGAAKDLSVIFNWPQLF